jgi:hypothetical protein
LLQIYLSLKFLSKEALLLFQQMEGFENVTLEQCEEFLNAFYMVSSLICLFDVGENNLDEEFTHHWIVLHFVEDCLGDV